MIYKNTYATIEKKWLKAEKYVLVPKSFVSYPQKVYRYVDNRAVYIIFHYADYVSRWYPRGRMGPGKKLIINKL